MSSDEDVPPMPPLGRTRATPVRAAAAASRSKNQQSTAKRALNCQTLPSSQKRSGRPPPVPPANRKKAPAAVAKKKKATTKKKKAEVKKETAAEASTKRPPNFSNDEDLFICKAFVNVSTDPTVGTAQKGKDFWDKVQAKFREIQAEEAEVEVVGNTRTPHAIMNRWQRHIMPSMNKYNKYYKEHKDLNHSGWKEEDYIKAAAETYLDMMGQPFKWTHCVEILHKMPRFHPMMAGYADPDLEEPDDNASKSSKKTHNQLGTAMGDGLERPMGSKAAKRLKKDELSVASYATAKSVSMDMLTASTAKMANALVTRGKQEMWMKQATFYASLGNMAKAQEFMDKIEADQARLEREEAEQLLLEAKAKATSKDSITESNTPSSAPVQNIEVLKPAATEGEGVADDDDVSRTSSGAIKQKDLEYDTDDGGGDVGDEEGEQDELSNSG